MIRQLTQNRIRSKGDRPRYGFTLIEVLLSTALAAILLGLISSAVYLHVRVLKRQHANIERSQIARNVLMMISRDLRGALQYKPADVTGLDELSVSQQAIAGIAAGAGIDPGLAAGIAGGDSTTPADDGSTASIGTAQTEVLRPGLYGNAFQLMIDVSRLPRIDEYDPVVVGGNVATQLPTDVKTVSYFVSQSSEESTRLQVGQDAAADGGLYRRQLDRAVAAHSPDLAAALASIGNTKLIATEVKGIQFRFFDGEEWVTEWDSDENGGFPLAVEVSILVDNQPTSSSRSASRTDPESGTWYRTVVNLPVAEMPEEDSSGNGGGG